MTSYTIVTLTMNPSLNKNVRLAHVSGARKPSVGICCGESVNARLADTGNALRKGIKGGLLENTYTYTARSALAPERIVTFTLYDHHMAVDVGAPLEQIGRVLQETEAKPTSEAHTEDQDGAVVTYPLKPAVVSLLERGAQPFSVADVYAQAEDDALVVTSWVRAGGLRLVPVRFAWQRVDNPEGASAFAQEVRARREVASPPGRFQGLMDYWISWLLLGVLLLALLLPRGGRTNQDADEG